MSDRPSLVETNSTILSFALKPVMFEESKGGFGQDAIADNQGVSVRGTVCVGRVYHSFTHGDSSHDGHHFEEITLVVADDR